jgi:hypothetical protein
MWGDAACLEERAINDYNFCLAETTVPEATHRPKQSGRNAGVPVHLIGAADGADFHSGWRGEAFLLRKRQHC